MTMLSEKLYNQRLLGVQGVSATYEQYFWKYNNIFEN